jgi:hypothetical protein
MMECVIAQADRCGEHGGNWPPIKVDRIKQLFNRGQWPAVIGISVSSKRAYLIDEKDACTDDIPLDEPVQRNDTNNPGYDHNPENERSGNFL